MPDSTPSIPNVAAEHAAVKNTSIVVTVPTALAEIVTDRMWQWGVQGVSEVAIGDGVVEVSTSVGNDREAILRSVAALDPSWTVELREHDVRLGAVDPKYLSPTFYAPDKVTVPASLAPIEFEAAVLVTVIDPGAAFGLGDHPTTSGAMALLAEHLAQFPGGASACAGVLDVGCGTGALGVLAAQLGVPMIRAIDIADAAVEATLRNMVLNDVVGRIDVDTVPVAELGGSFDVIVANILAPVLIAIADDLRRLLSPGGALIISGILDDRHNHVLEALAPLRPVESTTIDGWITIKLA